jgi:hypothetical protein
VFSMRSTWLSLRRRTWKSRVTNQPYSEANTLGISTDPRISQRPQPGPSSIVRSAQSPNAFVRTLGLA